MTFTYNFFIFFYTLAIKIASGFQPKAKEFLAVRKQYALPQRKAKDQFIIWMHCASVGEWEQGRPLLELLRQQQPESRLIVSFFSPSAAHLVATNKWIDDFFFLPLDTATNAQLVVNNIQPDLVFWVKYEFWWHHLKAIKQAGIKNYLVSAHFIEKSIFTAWYGSLHRKMLCFFEKIFVQNQASLSVLNKINVHQVFVAGDTRIDRVLARSEQPFENEIIQDFVKDKANIIIAGSIWPSDYPLLATIESGIIVPHEVDHKSIKKLITLFEGKACTYSDFKDNKSILIIDKLGWLSALYRFGHIAYIGGGFGKGVHNVLEPLAYGIPVMVGPNNSRFQEVQAGKKLGFVEEVHNSSEFLQKGLALLKNGVEHKKGIKSYFEKNRGAAATILKEVFQ